MMTFKKYFTNLKAQVIKFRTQMTNLIDQIIARKTFITSSIPSIIKLTRQIVEYKKQCNNLESIYYIQCNDFKFESTDFK